MNSSAWDKFRKQQATEREQLQRLLHSFYTGMENIFKRVAVELDGEPVRGDSWHRELLRRMKSPTAHRPALLSEELHDSLNEYLRFRHVFRNAYSFDLDWHKTNSPASLSSLKLNLNHRK